MSQIKIGIAYKKSEKLNHFLAAFESGREIDAQYFDRFAVAAESVLELLNTEMFEDFPSAYKDTMRQCITACETRDASKIREILPGFCEVFQQRLDAKIDPQTEEKELKEFLAQLKNALQKKDTDTANAIIKKISKIKLDIKNRELFFEIYDLFMDDRTDIALERIEQWLK